MDYRRLNSVSESDAYPMPRIDDLIDRLGEARFISTLDLTRGYWQVPVAEEARHKTAFATPFELYEFTVMPLGLQGAPATFQRLMDRIVKGCESFAAAYLDDLIIVSTSWSDHVSHACSYNTSKVTGGSLQSLINAMQFAMAECTYLGHIVGSATVKPQQS